MQTSRSIPPAGNRRGVALVIILAFVVLLTGLVIAFFSRSIVDRQLSNSSVSRAKVNAFADGAVNAIIDQLKQEIVLSSSSTPLTSATIYTPLSPAAMLPQLTGTIGITGTAALNLLKLSNPGQPFYTGSGGTIPATAVAVSSTVPSLNGRYVSPARWNKHYLLPLAANATDSTPDSTTFIPPSWVLVARDGSNPTPTALSSNLTASVSSTSSVVGRYAFAIYHEGGLLDVNAAGYPSTTGSNLSAYKPALAYADLTQIPGGLTPAMIDNLVAWRNYASIPVPGPSFLTPNFSSVPASGSNYFNLIVSNSAGFLTVSGTTESQSQTDRMFTSRQELIKFLQTGLGLSGTGLNVLNYLATFTRDINQPSYVRLQSTNPLSKLDYNQSVPKVLQPASGGNTAFGKDDQVNPSFLGVRVQQNKTFQRNDGTMAVAGEPLVKKRFALNRLAWLTYKGPSGGGNRNLTNPSPTGPDADIWSLEYTYGIPASFLQQGTTTNIQAYFGLTWDGQQWKYNAHNGTSGSGPSGAIMKLADIANLGAPHEPDFFELLKATINVGSLGKALLPSPTSMPADIGALYPQEQPYNYNYYAESSVDFQVIQIGANIISQFQTSNYPPRIVFDDGTGHTAVPPTFVGVSNLPYLSSIVTGVLQVQPPSVIPRNGKNNYPSTNNPGSGTAGDSGYQNGDLITTPGVGAILQLPVIWNPHDPTSSTGAAGAGPTHFRVVADSATPDQADGGTHNKFFVYAASMQTTTSAGASQFSYGADPSSPDGSWYRDLSGVGATLAQEITAQNSEIDVTLTSGTAPCFSEPTMLVTPGTITDSCSNQFTVAVGNSALIRQAPENSFTGNGLPSYFKDTYIGKDANAPYVGIYLGAFPMAWLWASGTNNAPLSAAQSGAFVARETTDAGGSVHSCYMTYRMQYPDPTNTNNWITYDTKYGKTFDGPTTLRVALTSGSNTPESLICGNGSISSSGVPGSGGYWAFATDPRTSRFGFLWNGTAPAGSGVNSPFSSVTGYYSYQPLPAYEYDNGAVGGWLVGGSPRTTWITLSIRPDRCPGFFSMAGWPFSGGGGPTKCGSDGTTSGWMAWVTTDPGGVGGSFPGLHPGYLCQNNADTQSYYKRFTADGYNKSGGGDGNTQTPEYFADPDGMVRRGMGAFIPPGLTARYTTPCITTVGLPMTRAFPYVSTTPSTQDPAITDYTSPMQTTSQAQSRPYFLHRPFRTVAELGYVFSDTPWRNLDFSTAESGGSALLDVFCINDTNDPNGLIAGKVNLNTRQVPVLKAILAEAYLDPTLLSGTAATAQIDAASTAGLVAQALVARTSNTTDPSLGPLSNVSELVGKRTANTEITHPSVSGVVKTPLLPGSPGNGFYDGKMSYAGFSDGGWDTSLQRPKLSSPATDVYSAYQNSTTFSTNGNYNGTQDTISYIQRFREAPIRALAASGQTRVWNLLIDVVAQTGRYPESAADLSKFVVEGEQHYWVHVAIDRYTGQIIDKQIEVVKE
jgi:Tfp pilus assembly protein PilX